MIVLDGRSLTPADLEAVCCRGAPVALAPAAVDAIERSRAVVEALLARGDTAYGINTGFGHLARVRIGPADVLELQANLLRSHAVGVGAPFDIPTTRGILLLRANVLAAGCSGVRLAVVERLIELLNRGVHPVVPCQGSVGASGDLAPLAHVALLLVGEGDVHAAPGSEPAAAALARVGLEPLRLEPKEGLALINGTQAMTALGTLALERARRVLDAADVIAAMTVEAKFGSYKPFDVRLQAVRPHPGQIQVAAHLRRLLVGGTINASHVACDRVQDPYSLRCVPQVHGASRDAFAYVEGVVHRELNAVTDNPTVFAEDGAILSGGNFHGQPVAMALDVLAIAVAEIGSISERRTEQLVNPRLDDLPPFLAGRPGLDSGYMMAQVTAAALVSENKGLCHPASVDSIPTSASQEDHVSMGPIAARKAMAVVRNVEHVLGIELLVAAQALELRQPLVPADGPAAALALLRRRVPTLGADRILHPDLIAAAELVASGALSPLIAAG